MSPSEVLDFWFGAPGTAESGAVRDFWFTKSDATDALIRERFGAVVESALGGQLDDKWAGTPRGTLALIIVLDQFTRNIFRSTPRAFAGDAQALALAKSRVAAQDDFTMSLFERWFAYMPFEHSESIEDQRMAVALFERLGRDGLETPLPWAHKHCEVIERFGRFPHRNEILGRLSTPEEIEFLRQPGSSF